MDDDECPICYQKLVLALELTCHHTFCFLCIKGVYEGANGVEPRCALCRSPINGNLFVNPTLKGSIDLEDPEEKQCSTPTGSSLPKTPLSSSPLPKTASQSRPKRPFWLYQANDKGWWRFDPRVERDMEEKLKKNDMVFDFFISGHAFRMDLCSMTQTRLNVMGAGGLVAGMVRSLKRVEDSSELETIYVKGVAGVRLTD